MDDLFAAIAEYLCHHNPRLRALCPPLGLLALACCRSCGEVIAAGGDPRTLGPLLAARRCLACYLASEVA